ncbi:MAG: glycoside hydrolase family 20 zincin-like fold domain-containing protein [Acidobacteriaceae bacterium]
MRALVIAAVASVFCCIAHAQTVSPLFARGYTVVPEPQKVSLDGSDFTFNQAWQLKIDNGVAKDDVAVDALREGLASRFNVRMGAAGGKGGTLTLRIQPGSVPIGTALDSSKGSLEQQAYRIDLHREAITITANASTGLFYGVETLLQLLRRDMGTLWLPQGSIVDWPDMELRHIYWDDNHHLEHVDELKRDLRQAAFYKINGFVIKLDGHFQYKSAPAVVEPYALTPAELQELTNYGLRYHVQLIPYLDGPAHISFILKHPEYANLREYPESNYEICSTNPASYKLLEGMYQDLLDANKGVKYFYLSTDEPYYLGLAHNSQCNEADLAKQLGSVGKVFAHFVDKAGGYLHDQGRSVIFWGEYPMKPSDLSSLPPYVINGEVYGPTYDKAFHQRGIRQMIFTSTEGEEKLFPDYFILPQSDRLHGASNDEFEDSPGLPRVDDIMKKISFDSSRVNTSVIGEVDAGWADEGVNPETFWLGYVAGVAAGWHPGMPSAPELSSAFYSLFYGVKVVSMDRVYQLMSEQAQSWNDSWDPMESKARKPIWGSSYAIFNPPHPAHDQTLPLPPVPDNALDYSSTWSKENSRRIALALQAEQQNQVLLGLLHENLQRAQFNRYNLQVYLTIADLCQQNLAMIVSIHRMDVDLAAASQAKEKDPKEAISEVDSALDTATSIWQQRNQVLKNSVATWNERWYPRAEEANGRRFLHELDDVKDHLPDRTTDMSYLVYREKLLPFGEWVNAIAAARNRFAAAHNLPTRNYRLAWDDFSAVPAVCSSASDLMANPQLRPADVDQAATCGMGE